MGNAGTEVGEPPRVFHAVVDPREQDVLERDALTRTQRVILEGLAQYGEVVATSHGHERRSLLVAGGIQADGEQRAHRPARKLAELRDEPRRRDRDAAWRQPETEWVAQELDGFLHRARVVQRLPHPHEDERERARVTRTERMQAR